MTVVISLVLIVLVAALVGRTCARARPGSRFQRPAGADGGSPVVGGDGGSVVDVTDPGPRHGGWGSGTHHSHSSSHHDAGHGGGGWGDSGFGGDSGGGGGDSGGGGGGD